ADGDSLSAVLVSGVSHGTLSLNADGSFSYVPAANYHGPDSFTFKANDGNGGESNVATVSIDGESVDDAPGVVNGSHSATEDTTLSVGAPGVLSGSSDADGDALSAILASGPSHGTLTLQADGSFSYAPAANYNGLDSFTFKASDGNGGESNVATVTISVAAVNDAPVVVNGSHSATEDTVLSVGAPGVLSGSSDADGDALSAVLVGGPSHR